MDYDGANQHAITHLGTISISPRVSPDNSRLAFASLGKYGFQLKMYSLLLGRYVNFPSGDVSRESPAWAPSGNEIAYAAAPDGYFNIWIADSNGNLARRITNFRGGACSPTYNPKTGAQIAFISGRTGLPQLYIMNSDGSGVQQMTDGGYASSPSWSPNGQFIAFAWDRKYGPGAPGGQDIYIMEIATKTLVAAHPRWGPLRLPLLVARRPPHRLRQLRRRPRRPHPHLDHARRRHPEAPTHRPRRRHAELELEITARSPLRWW